MKLYIAVKGMKPFRLQEPYRKIVSELAKVLAGCYEYNREDREFYLSMAGVKKTETPDALTEAIETSLRAGLKETPFQKMTETIIARVKAQSGSMQLEDLFTRFEIVPLIAKLIFADFPDKFDENDLDEGVVNTGMTDFFAKRKGM